MFIMPVVPTMSVSLNTCEISFHVTSRWIILQLHCFVVKVYWSQVTQMINHWLLLSMTCYSEACESYGWASSNYWTLYEHLFFIQSVSWNFRLYLSNNFHVTPCIIFLYYCLAFEEYNMINIRKNIQFYVKNFKMLVIV